MPNYWILKTEPSSYSFDRLVKERRAVWDGVSNALALKHIRSMAKGDQASIYHTEPYPDPKGDDPKLAVVDIEAGAPLGRPVTLAAIKADPAFAELALVRMSRLSVVPVPPNLWKRLLAMGGVPG